MEEVNRVKRKSILELVILVVAFLLLFAGVSFAMYRIAYTGDTSRINTTSVGIDFLENNENIISINNGLPKTDEEGINQDEEFTFAVKTKTTRSSTIRYTIYINKLISSEGYDELEDSDIKVYLEDYEGNPIVNPVLISNLNNYELYSKNHTHNTINEEIQDKYRLRVWIDNSKSTEAQTWNTNTQKEYKFKLEVRMSETQNN